jgi:hypothetical protein
MTEPIKLPPITMTMLMEVFGAHADIPSALLSTSWKDGIDVDEPSHKAQELVRLAVEQNTVELREQIRCLENDAAGEAVVFDIILAERNEARAEVEKLRVDAERWKCVCRHSWKELQRVRVLAGIKTESVLGQNWEDAIDDLLEAAGTTEQAIAARKALKEPK